MDSLFPKVLQAVPVRGFKVHAYMNDGTLRCMDIKPLIDKGGVFAPLNNPDTFNNALTVLNDTIAWDITGKRDPTDCIDIDPFTIQALPSIKEAM